MLSERMFLPAKTERNKQEKERVPGHLRLASVRLWHRPGPTGAITDEEGFSVIIPVG